MYWNGESAVSLASDSEININMRCIEISGFKDGADVLNRLTLTWDVLK